MSTAELDSMRWTDISMDPNSPAALDDRRRALGSVKVLPPQDRLEFIRTMVRGRRVLDVGCVDHFADAAVAPGFLHRAVAASAGECLGIDVHRSGVEALARSGFAVARVDITDPGDVEELRARGRFDVIVVGEVIEHLERPSAVMELAARLLKDDGTLVVTTPNPYAPHRVGAGRRMSTWENVDHLCYLFPSGIVEMAQRQGLKLDECMTTGPRSWRTPSVLTAKWVGWRVRRMLRRDRTPRDVHDVPLFDVLALFALHRSERRWLGETAVYVLTRIR